MGSLLQTLQDDFLHLSSSAVSSTWGVSCRLCRMISSTFLLLLFPLHGLGKDALEKGENGTKKGPVLPYYASIFIDSAWFCTGAFISDSLVLTAAHCLDGGSFFDISIGGPGGQQFSSNEAILHPNYDPTTGSADLAVIRLSEAAQVDPATLPSVGDILQVGDSVCLDNLDGNFVCAPVMSKADCNAVYGVVPDDIVCLDQSGNMCEAAYSGAPAVVGDDGGPWTLGGVTAWASSSGCYSGSPIGITRVEYYIDWINGL